MKAFTRALLTIAQVITAAVLISISACDDAQARQELAECRAELARVTTQAPPGSVEPQEPTQPPQQEPARAGVWRNFDSVDPLTQRPIKRASVDSREEFELDFPYRGPQRARLVVREHPQHGQDVMLMIERGQIPCRVRGCDVQVVFDDSDPIRWRANGAADGSSEVIFLRQYDRFVRRLDDAREVRIAVTIYQAGTKTFTFPGRSEESDG